MKYRVSGTNHDNGARMTLEFEAESRAAAERKAIQSRMDVSHIVDITEEESADEAAAKRAAHRGDTVNDGRMARFFIGMMIVLALAAVAYFVVWPRVRATMGS